jgi:hypothetical protein
MMQYSPTRLRPSTTGTSSMMPPDNNNSPCDNPNPPAWCDEVPIPFEHFDIMLLASFSFGLLLLYWLFKAYHNGYKHEKNN